MREKTLYGLIIRVRRQRYPNLEFLPANGIGEKIFFSHMGRKEPRFDNIFRTSVEISGVGAVVGNDRPGPN